jgi:hypothetical protein
MGAIVKTWTEDEINNIELFFLHNIMDCKEKEEVDSAVTFAKYLAKVKLNPDNYPVFLKFLLYSSNHWVVDALVGDNDPVGYFNIVQPNHFIIQECFKILSRYKPGGIYEKTVLVVIGLIKSCYDQPLEGYRIYPLTIADINNMGKNLDKEKGQTDPMNRTILFILDRLASMAEPGHPITDKEMAEVSNQSNNIRGKFLDMTKTLNEAIPDNMLKRDDYKKSEIEPTITFK